MKNRFPRHIAAMDENGSMIVIVLMLLTLMSIIGIASTNTTVMENFIVRNSSLRKENLHMVDSVATEAYQRVNDVEYADPADPTAFLKPDQIMPDMPGHFNWVLDKDLWRTSGNLAAWYNRAHVGPILTAANSTVPDSVTTNDIDVLTQRGYVYDAAHPELSPIRYALVGWDYVTEGGESIAVNQPGVPTIKKADLLVEYLSPDYGIIRLIVGVQKQFG